MLDQMCVLDQLSFNIVNGEGFRAFCYTANLIENPGDLPSFDAIVYTHLTKIADACVAGLKLILRQSLNYSFLYIFGRIQKAALF